MGDDAESLCHLAEQALANGDEQVAEERLSGWLRLNSGNAVVWHWCAMLRRSLDRRDEAIAALQHALRRDPGNVGIAHALAQVMVEAGLPAARLFEKVVQAAPAKADARLGLLAARFAEGEGDRGLAELEAMLDANANWEQGHREFAQVSALMGRADRSMATIDRALERFPHGDALRKLAMDLLVEAERYSEVLDRAERAIALRGELAPFALLKAIGLDETGRSEEAGVLYTTLGSAISANDAVWRLRHALRTGEAARAGLELEPWLRQPGAEAVWPYAATIWRLTGDPRSEWLEASGSLCKVIDLDPVEIGLNDLMSLLGRLHRGAGCFLDQSVRGGTQTVGALLCREDAEIARLREVLRREVGEFVERLPEFDGSHPTLGQKRTKRLRFSGSWSVRLGGAGFHAPHHHPQGWISSALYVAVPEVEGFEGHLEIGGAPAGLSVDLPPRQRVEPRPGRLVLFPSWHWHGTVPFREGERMSVAFDIGRA